MQNLPLKGAFLPAYSFRHKVETNFTFFRSKPAPIQTKSRLKGQREPGSFSGFWDGYQPSSSPLHPNQARDSGCSPLPAATLNLPQSKHSPGHTGAANHTAAGTTPFTLKHINSLLEVNKIMTRQFFPLESPTFSPPPGKGNGAKEPLGTFHSNLNTQFNQNLYFTVYQGHD